MNYVDKQYLELCQDILDNGTFKEDRTGTGTLSVFGRSMRFDLRERFPLLTTKKTWFKGVLYELLWFLGCHQSYSEEYANLPQTNIKFLTDNKVRIWNEWADEKGNLGPVYGKQWRNWVGYRHGYEEGVYQLTSQRKETKPIDQIQNVIDTLKTNPDSRRIMVNAWNVSEIGNMALPPCHYSFQFYSEQEKDCEQRSLSMIWNQRSCDFPLGIPYNIASYATLVHIIAKLTNHKPKELIFNGGDCHIYMNQIEGIKEQLKRDPETHPAPVLTLSDAIEDINTIRPEDFHLKYSSEPTIKFPIAV